MLAAIERMADGPSRVPWDPLRIDETRPPSDPLGGGRWAAGRQLVADLVEPSRSEALDKLGEGRQALDVASAWVRLKLAPKATLRRMERRLRPHNAADATC